MNAGFGFLAGDRAPRRRGYHLGVLIVLVASHSGIMRVAIGRGAPHLRIGANLGKAGPMGADHVHEDGGREPGAWVELVPLVYDELRAMARRQLRRERDSHTLNTTGLVHETYLRLVDQRATRWQDRSQFFAIAARVMRRVLIDYARQHRAAKRGGAAPTITLERVEQAMESDPMAEEVRSYTAADERAELLMALDDAVSRLAAVDERIAQVVECRFFGGLSEEETAAALGVTARTVRRDWVKAKQWLRRELEP